MQASPGADPSQRLAELETRVASAFALDSRLKSIEGELTRLKSSTLRDWIQTLGPYVSGVLVLIIGFWIKDSVTLGLQREQLNLEYVKEMRDMIKDFDEAQSESAATANAIGLAMFGRYGVLPLVERLRAGDVAAAAAVRGLRLVGASDPAGACEKFLGVLEDRGRRYPWQTQKTLVRISSQSVCIKALPVFEQTRGALQAAGSDPARLAAFATRYDKPTDFDAEAAAALGGELDQAISLLRAAGTL